MRYKKVILKFSGEILKTDQQNGPIDYQVVRQLCLILKKLHDEGCNVGVVLGGGNIFRGLQASKFEGYERVCGDNMGMLATVINCLAVKNCLSQFGVESQLYSALMIPDICEYYTVRSAVEAFFDGKILLLSGGTGNPFFSTDSAAALRASELQAELVLKATRVDGVYDRDPEKYPDAKKFDTISFQDVLKKHLNVMDSTAFALCMDNNIPILVTKVQMNDMSSIVRALHGERLGTLVGNFD